MSHKVNEEWLEAATENFQTAIDQGNYALAQAVIADTRDAGFSSQAEAMEKYLVLTPVEQFAIKSNIADIV